MADENQQEAPPSKLALPPATIEAVHMTRMALRPALWAQQIASHIQRGGPLAFSNSLLRRFEIVDAPGLRAADFARGLLPETLDINAIELTVSPYAPPMRQLSSIRQGVPMWSGSESRSTPTPQPTPRPAATSNTPRPAGPPRLQASKPQPEENEVPKDLLAILNMHRALGRIE